MTRPLYCRQALKTNDDLGHTDEILSDLQGIMDIH